MEAFAGLKVKEINKWEVGHVLHAWVLHPGHYNRERPIGEPG